MQITLMSRVEDIIDEFSGLITRKQAIALDRSGSPILQEQGRKRNPKRPAAIKVKELVSRIDDIDTVSSTIDIEDKIYRVFNPSRVKTMKGETDRRMIVLGEEGMALPVSLIGSSSELLDTERIERGDTVVVRNLILNSERDRLYGTSRTTIAMASKSVDESGQTSDFSSLKQGYADVIGKVIEIDPIGYTDSNGRRTAVSACTITDSRESMRVSLWGSSALCTERMSVNNYIKIEFCRLSEKDGLKTAAADSSSRILVLDMELSEKGVPVRHKTIEIPSVKSYKEKL